MTAAPQDSAHLATWLIAAAAILGIIVRPRQLPEALWAVLGAVTLLAFALISGSEAWEAVRSGTDVYWFLIGMMLLAELARTQGLFAWLAAYAVMHARGSARRLFLLIYLVGAVVTVFMSNDATAVVLTPAVYAAARAARARPMPYLYICAFIANAASFVLPISNPANLVVFGAQMPVLGEWLIRFGPASVLSILLSYFALRLTQRRELAGPISRVEHIAALPLGGRIAAAGIGVTAVILLGASLYGLPLGGPALLAAIATWLILLALRPESPRRVLGSITWSILPLVAGLFVLARGIDKTGVLALLGRRIASAGAAEPHLTAFTAGAAAALASNAVNNLPLGLLAGSMIQRAHLAPRLASAMLIGVDLGPNLSVTGSLATILWLVALRREGQEVSARRFLLFGAMVMPPALIGALAVVALH